MGYGENLAGLPTFWFLIDFGLLMLVQVRRSRFARGLIITTSVLGAALYLPAVSHHHGSSAMFVAFVIQALALSAPPVRRHVEQTIA